MLLAIVFSTLEKTIGVRSRVQEIIDPLPIKTIFLILSPPSPLAFEIILFLDEKSLLIKANMLINKRDVVLR